MSKPHLKEFKIVNHKKFPGFLEELELEKFVEMSKIQGLPKEEIESYVSAEQKKLAEKLEKEQAELNAQNGQPVLDENEEIEGIGDTSDSESSPYESGQSNKSSSSQQDDSQAEDEEEDGEEDEGHGS